METGGGDGIETGPVTKQKGRQQFTTSIGASQPRTSSIKRKSTTTTSTTTSTTTTTVLCCWIVHLCKVDLTCSLRVAPAAKRRHLLSPAFIEETHRSGAPCVRAGVQLHQWHERCIVGTTGERGCLHQGCHRRALCAGSQLGEADHGATRLVNMFS